MPRHTVKKIVPVQVPVQQVQSFPAQKEEPKRSVIGFTDKKDMKICQIFGPIFYSES